MEMTALTAVAMHQLVVVRLMKTVMLSSGRERERERERERADMYQSLDQSFRQHHQSAQHGRQKYAALHQAADSLHITTAQ